MERLTMTYQRDMQGVVLRQREEIEELAHLLNWAVETSRDCCDCLWHRRRDHITDVDMYEKISLALNRNGYEDSVR